ncbi:MAG TPA: cytochrome c-type biogenesis protein CcmH [Gemmatimonadales bacterium]|jgi:cytochrome c-type biogenesis protein CcmH|nr:cytochrome c-type biogenesis protein CcmH [Gemmatimonadales bacterium]
MTRRELFRRAAAVALVPALLPRRADSQAGQKSPQEPPAGDRLYDPSMVQQRPEATALDNDPVIKSLEHRLKCTCGCNLDVYTCRTTDFTCTYSPALHREVLSLRREGKSPDEVVAAFVAEYGEQILMAPKPEGFNLAGYLLPGAVVVVVGALLAAVLVRRGRRQTQPAAAIVAAPVPGNPTDDERLRQALAEVED